jgi:hypothetical protein
VPQPRSLSSADRNAFTAAVSVYASVGEVALRDAFEVLRVRRVERGEYFVRAGQMATEVAVVV